MTKNRTEKSKYPSRYSPGGWVSAPQYITEFICEKKAQKDRKELPIKFWEIKEWRNYYRYQITLANKLLKEFTADVIIAALKDNRCWKTYSLRAPMLRGIIEEKSNEATDRESKANYDVADANDVKHKSGNTQKSIISKLRELDE
jgi:hypothetical protein